MIHTFFTTILVAFASIAAFTTALPVGHDGHVSLVSRYVEPRGLNDFEPEFLVLRRRGWNPWKKSEPQTPSPPPTSSQTKESTKPPEEEPEKPASQLHYPKPIEPIHVSFPNHPYALYSGPPERELQKPTELASLSLPDHPYAGPFRRPTPLPQQEPQNPSLSLPNHPYAPYGWPAPEKQRTLPPQPPPPPVLRRRPAMRNLRKKYTSPRGSGGDSPDPGNPGASPPPPPKSPSIGAKNDELSSARHKFHEGQSFHPLTGTGSTAPTPSVSEHSGSSAYYTAHSQASG